MNRRERSLIAKIDKMFNKTGSLSIETSEYRTEDVNTIKANYFVEEQGTKLVLKRCRWQTKTVREKSIPPKNDFVSKYSNGCSTLTWKDGTEITTGKGVSVSTKYGYRYSPY